MAYSVRIDDNFNRADVGPVVAGSTAIGNSWEAVGDNIWGIRSGVAKTVNNAGNFPLTTPLLRPASENCVDGRIVIYNKYAGGTGTAIGGPIARYSTTDNTGYAGFIYNASSVYFSVNGTQVGGFDIGTTLTADSLAEWTWTQVDADTTQWQVKCYLASDPTTQVGNTVTWANTEASLQNRNGRIGIGAWNEANTDRAVLSAYVAGGPITDVPVLSLVSAYRTFVNLVATAAQGGTGALSYQLQSRANSGASWADVAGQTTITNLQVTNLPMGAARDYRVKVTDGSDTQYSNVLTVTTVKSRADGGHVISFVGTSITFGVTKGDGIATYPARQRAIDFLTANGVSCAQINAGHSGYDTGQTLSVMSAIIAQAQALDSDIFSFCSNTNDILHTNSPTHTVQGYRSAVVQICAAALADGTGINTVALHDDIGIGGGTQEQYALAAQMNAVLDDIVANDNFGGRVVRGVTGILDAAIADPDFNTDIHPVEQGQYKLGTWWALGLYAVFTTPAPAPTLTPTTGSAVAVGDTFTVSSLIIDAINEYRIGTGAWTAYSVPVALNSLGSVTVHSRSHREGYPLSIMTSATYTVTGSAPTPAITGITISPTSANVQGGGTRNFSSVVSGTGDFDDSVTFSLLNGGTGDSLNPTSATTATLTAGPATDSLRTLTVRATAADDTHVANATVTIPAASSGGGTTVVQHLVTLPLDVRNQTETPLVEGDTGPVRSVQLVDVRGNIVSLVDGATVAYRLTKKGDDAPTIDNDPATIDHGPTGLVSYAWPGGIPDPGSYYENWIVTLAGGEQVTFPSGRPSMLTVRKRF
jgi:hypothetical protein